MSGLEAKLRGAGQSALLGALGTLMSGSAVAT